MVHFEHVIGASFRRTVRGSAVVSAGLCAALLVGCANATPSSSPPNDDRSSATIDGKPAPEAASRLVVGSPEPGLSFTVSPTPSPVAATAAGPSLTARAPRSEITAARSANEAVAAFGTAIVEGRIADAFALLPENEQDRLGSATRFADLLNREPSWSASALDAANSEGDVVALRVTQTPSIDEIRGVVGPAAVIRLPARKDASGWKVSWERRAVNQVFAAPDERVVDDVLAWASARQQQCDTVPSPSAGARAGEHSGGLLGALWLADELCAKPGAVTSTEVGDIYNLDDPQALLDAFGSDAYRWARVVTLASPHAMQVIAAPLADRWIVVGIAPVRSAN